MVGSHLQISHQNLHIKAVTQTRQFQTEAAESHSMIAVLSNSFSFWRFSMNTVPKIPMINFRSRTSFNIEVWKKKKIVCRIIVRLGSEYWTIFRRSNSNPKIRIWTNEHRIRLSGHTLEGFSPTAASRDRPTEERAAPYRPSPSPTL